jgi:16S rRNA (guanine966-N2)-methyltransferase
MIPAVGTPKTELAGGGRAAERKASARRNPNSVRIIGGAWRGRRIAFPDLPGLRPTPDRVRETLFNWLQHAVAGARCLDLFAGSGALGLEALSRGAREVVFVEQASTAVSNLRAQLSRLDARAPARILEADALRFLQSPGEAFDVAFLDPPFGTGVLPQYVGLLETGNWLSNGGLIYLENGKREGVPTLPAHWELLKSKFAGEVGYHLVRVNRRIQPND